MKRLTACVTVLLSLAGCERLMHDMYSQPRFEPGQGTPLFPDGRSDRPPPAGSIPVTASLTPAQEPPFTRQLIERGRDRFTIYCLPCHGALGDGNGPVAQHGFPHPPSYHEQRLRDAPDAHFVDVITHGYGIMYSYADRVEPADRWAITAYIRALQLSRNAPAAELPPALLARLAASGAKR